MHYTQVASIQAILSTYNERIMRYGIIAEALPIFYAELERTKDKIFNIATVNAIAKELNAHVAGIMAYASKGTDYKDRTYYQVTIHYTFNNMQKYEVIDNRYRDDNQGLHDGMIAMLKRFDDCKKWIDDTNALIASLPDRHAKALIALDELKKYEDLITN